MTTGPRGRFQHSAGVVGVVDVLQLGDEASVDFQIEAVISDRGWRLFSRVAEDAVAAAMNAWHRQVVILGAGLDTFAYRHQNADPRGFEIDHPAAQA